MVHVQNTVCMYVCVHMYVYVCVYACIYMHVCMNAYMYVICMYRLRRWVSGHCGGMDPHAAQSQLRVCSLTYSIIAISLTIPYYNVPLSLCAFVVFH